MYDKTPVYPHHADLFWAYEPYKTIYVLQRILTTLFLVPCWIVYYGIMPRNRRPRPSWSLYQIVVVKFMKRISKVVEVAGVTWGTRDPTLEPEQVKLKETRFEWAPPLPKDLRTGFVHDEHVECKPVGMYVWPKDPHPSVLARKAAKSATEKATVPAPQPAKDGDDPEGAPADAPPRLIGVYLHGGGYCHYSAHESSGTSRVPRRLINDGYFQEIYAVEYRLLQHAPVPGALQDAAAVYAHLVLNELGAKKGEDGRYYIPEPSRRDKTHPPAEADEIPKGRHRTKIVLIGDSAGGNLVLALARWIRDEARLPPPDAMLLLSPSCDPSHTLPQVPASRRPRPHEETDYLLDTPEPRALLQRTFLGHHPPEFVYSPYISPSSEWVLSVFHGPAGLEDLQTVADIRQGNDTRAWREGPGEVAAHPNAIAAGPSDVAVGRTACTNPYIRDPSGQGLFTNFPRTLVVVGDAERLEREVLALERGMERDGVRVRMVWAKDGCHDLLILAYWDEKVREGIWREIARWVREIEAEP
ncbi:alpha/beta-hydrolase [Vararia minispora EC-137]|uniref:Alpha/beta-hydrolase n=1 Tax=Vararia minispora EC-137 TaxID=1314806 RepID=A0ACB8QMK1_9AGAM|nr:alpha/beta-hydrolase [Vararia minispora EC-137]